MSSFSDHGDVAAILSGAGAHDGHPSLSTKGAGYDYDFVTPPSDSYICQICLLVARDPYQLTCCGKVYCKRCLDNHKEKSREPRVIRVACPNCRNRLYLGNNKFEDTKTKREILNLTVYCTKRKDGCSWQGPLRDISDHHGKDCQYRSTMCAQCHKLIKRINLVHHKSNECLLRDYKCPLCEEPGTYQDIVGSHLDSCPDNEIACPNKGCFKILKRCKIADHRDECDHENVPCAYDIIGCDSVVKRKYLPKHEEDSTSVHLRLALAKISAQSLIIDKYTHRDQYTCSSDGNPYTIRKVAYTDDYVKCPPFYTSPGGYKMSIVVYPDGNKGSMGTHLSCYVEILSGDYDDTLEWPFRGEVTVELLNQLEDKNHYKDVFVLDDDVPEECRERVTGGKRSNEGWGEEEFIAHTDLMYKHKENIQYLKNDALYFRVSTKVYSMTKPWLCHNPQ